ncbi:MAG: CapA family protein [Rhizobiales bacterium]|nr:CapA family protein [Hyphomicrobiales bacterium]
MKIGIAGDVFLDRPMTLAETMGPDLRAAIAECDATFVNFEGPISTDSDAPAFKTGPNLKQWPGSLRLLAEAGVTGIGLANNHALDFGPSNLSATIREAEAHGLLVAGLHGAAGPSPVLVETADMTVAMLAFAEEEWCGRLSDPVRIALLDPIQAARSIKRAKLHADAVIVCLHANNEHSTLPHPTLVELCRFLVDMGAAAVLVAHAHAVSGMELHKGRPILYGLGNFLFTRPSSSPRWFEGLFCVLDITGRGDDLRVTALCHPVTFGPARGVELAPEPVSRHILNEVDAASRIIASDASLAAHFALFAAEHGALFDESLNPWWREGRWKRWAGRHLSKHLRKDPRRQALLLNFMRCDSHRAAMRQHLETRIDGGVRR